MENNDKINQLFTKYIDGICTKEEMDELLHYFESKHYEGLLKSLIKQDFNQFNDHEIYSEEIEAINQEIRKELFKEERRINYLRWIKPLASIAAVVALFFLINYFIQPVQVMKTTEDHRVKVDVLNKDRAILSIAGGQEMVLAGDKGIITNSGTIRYENGTSISEGLGVQTIRLTTPLASQYQAQLPDGSRVWLNAGSVLEYPSDFEKSNRSIYVSGEAYLEVAKDPTRPFIVNSDHQKAEVLGTKFNINTYADEEGQILTTLMEGSLRVTNTINQSSVILVPGKQARLGKATDIQVNDIDIDEVKAWKDGMFILNNKTLGQYAHHIERWYDVEIDMGVYKQVRLSTIIPRKASLTEVLGAIELKTGVKFKIDERRVIAIKE